MPPVQGGLRWSERLLCFAGQGLLTLPKWMSHWKPQRPLHQLEQMCRYSDLMAEHWLEGCREASWNLLNEKESGPRARIGGEATTEAPIRTLRWWSRQLLFERIKHRRGEGLSLFPNVKKLFNLLLYKNKNTRKLRELNIGQTRSSHE
jgi:hypothetical protein